jgi:hypothetical protein
MSLTATQFHATCDCIHTDTKLKCGQEGIGTLQHLSTKGWMLKINNTKGEAEIISILRVISIRFATIICPQCSVTGAWKE